MITFLSGGTGTPRLIRAARQILYDAEIAVVANTAEDLWISGNHCAPDVDTAMYLFAGILNTGTWWGIAGDTYSTHRYLPKVEGAEAVPIGDRARAVQIARAAHLREGGRKTAVTEMQCRALGVAATVLPVTDVDVRTVVDTGTDRLPLLEYWMGEADDTEEVREILRTFREPPVITDEVRAAVEASDAVVIGPSNPARSILPILDCEGMRDLLADRFVVAVSPFRGDIPPDPRDAALMYAIGEKPTSPGVFRLYRDLVDVFVQDLNDPDDVEGSLRLETHLWRKRQSESLAWDIMAVIRHAVS
jgi:LPPG:FO 2-phospho-L-lactate transferase